MTEFALLDHKADQFDLVVEVMEAEKMDNSNYHLIAPNGAFCGTLVRDEDGWEFHSTVESDGDRIYCELPERVVEGFLEQVEVVQK